MKRSFHLALAALLCLAAGAAILSRAMTIAARRPPAPLHAARTPLLLPDDGWASSGPLWPLAASRHGE